MVFSNSNLWTTFYYAHDKHRVISPGIIAPKTRGKCEFPGFIGFFLLVLAKCCPLYTKNYLIPIMVLSYLLWCYE